MESAGDPGSAAGWSDAVEMFKQLGQSKGLLYQQPEAGKGAAARRLSMWRLSRRGSVSGPATGPSAGPSLAQVPASATPRPPSKIPFKLSSSTSSYNLAAPAGDAENDAYGANRVAPVLAPVPQALHKAQADLLRQTCDPASLRESVRRYRESKRACSAQNSTADENLGMPVPLVMTEGRSLRGSLSCLKCMGDEFDRV